MEQQPILSEILSNLQYYSNVERKIAEIILKDPKRFITYSMAEISEIAGVSQGSVNNFAKKLTGAGYAALKLQIAQQLPGREEKVFNLAEAGDGVKDILRKTGQDLRIAFGNTAVKNREETLRNVAELILEAKRIEIYGIYRSSIVAMDLYYQLLQLGLHATFVSDVLMCQVSAALLNRDDLVIAISSSGRTKDILDCVKIAKGNQVPVICMTADSNAPLVKLSDEALFSLPSGNSISNRMDEVRLSH